MANYYTKKAPDGASYSLAARMGDAILEFTRRTFIRNPAMKAEPNAASPGVTTTELPRPHGESASADDGAAVDQSVVSTSVTTPTAGGPMTSIDSGARPASLTRELPTDDANAEPDSSAADPVTLADLCIEGGFPALIAPMLQTKATLVQVRAKVEEARAIQLLANDMGLSKTGAHLIAAGTSFAAARGILEAAKEEWGA